MKLAFSTLACPGWSLDQVVEAALRYGYQGVELRLVDGELIDAGMPAAERERVRRVFARAGLPIVAVDTSVRVASPDAATALRELEPFLELANSWESPVVRVFGGEGAVAQAREVLGRAARSAEPLGVRVALETHDRFSAAELVAEVLDGLPAAVAALWDTGHPHRVGDGPERVLRLLDGRIAHVHLKDARRSGQDWELTLLGEGEVPVKACVEGLRAAGYDGWLSVEWEKRWHPGLAEPEVALPQFAETVRSWVGVL
ncbi:MAG TPA: sugar phosphate isomerase/epimerase family protein [Candidatus Dormibacteraeota bacterium]